MQKKYAKGVQYNSKDFFNLSLRNVLNSRNFFRIKNIQKSIIIISILQVFNTNFDYKYIYFIYTYIFG